MISPKTIVKTHVFDNPPNICVSKLLWSNVLHFVSEIKLGNFGHQVNPDIHLQIVKIQMKRLLMSRLIRIFTVCLVIFIPSRN